VDDGLLTDRDSRVAAIAAVDSMGASLLPGTNVIRLGTSKPFAWLSLEPRGGSFTVQEVVPSTITMSRATSSGSVSIPAVASKTIVGRDADRDGVLEMVVAFGKSDLRALFGDLAEGSSAVAVSIGGSLVSGTRFVASAVLQVDTGKHALAASLSPNPFNPDATLTVTTTRPGPVRIRVFDVSGRLVRSVVDAGALAAGFHDFAISRREGGAQLASGVYLYRVETGEGTLSGRMVVLK
jgi:hypothetical protein